MQKGVLFHGAAAKVLVLTVGERMAIGRLAVGCGRRDVGNLFGNGVLTADRCDTDVRGFAGFGEGIVAAVEVFTLLQIRKLAS